MDAALEHDASYWRDKYEEAQKRLAKLWVFYERMRRERDGLRQAQDAQVRIVEPVVTFDPAASDPPASPAVSQAEESTETPYRHGDYTLHQRDVLLKNGKTQPFYFFARAPPRSGTPCALPAGYEVGVNARTKLLYLRRAGTKGKAPQKKYRPQCMALASSGMQCRNSSRAGSHYCMAHKGYRPPTAAKVLTRLDTVPRDSKAHDTAPATLGSPAKRERGAQQCRALTLKGAQCLGDARAGSSYCQRHKGYRPRSVDSAVSSRRTKPRFGGATDTAPAVRKTRR